MIFKSNVYRENDLIDKFALFPFSFMGHRGNFITIWLQKYQIRIIDCAHGEILVNGISMGHDHWDH